MSAPVITIDSNNVGTWTNPGSPPSLWYIFPCFADGSFAPDSSTYSFQIAGSSEAHDFTGYPSGYYVKMFGIDSSYNLIISPTISATPVAFE